MSEQAPENAEKRTECKVLHMSAIAEASSKLRDIAEPRPVGDTVKQAITRAARAVSRHWPMSYSRAEDIWRQEARIIRAEEMDAIRQTALEKARAEYRLLQDRLAATERFLSVSDPDFHRATIDALRHVAGRPHRPMDSGD